MTPYLTEEAAESVDAIAAGDADATGEELGDLLFLAVFCLELLGERSGPGVAEALDRASAKLIRRHPHVYGDARVESGEGAYRQWQEIKKAETPNGTLLGSPPKGLAALVAAYRIQEKAAAVGFDWPTTDGPLGKIREEIEEVSDAMDAGGETTGREIGDLLFAVVNLSRHLRIDPERELRGATRRFRERFHHIERRLGERDQRPADVTLADLDVLWEEAKQLERAGAPTDTAGPPPNEENT
jgi:ATP diphosphatase